MADLYDFTLPATGADQLPLWDLHGLVVLLVVLPPEARSTPQTQGIQKLYGTFSGQGFVVVGVPMSGRPGTGTDFGVTFPVLAPAQVDGPTPDALFAWLHSVTPGRFGTTDVSGYTKFLIGRDGRAIARFDPTADARELIQAVRDALSVPVPAPPPRPAPVPDPVAPPDDAAIPSSDPISPADPLPHLPAVPAPSPRGVDGGEIVDAEIIDAEIVSLEADVEIVSIESDLEESSPGADLMDLAQELRIIEAESAVIEEQHRRPPE